MDHCSSAREESSAANSDSVEDQADVSKLDHEQLLEQDLFESNFLMSQIRNELLPQILKSDVLNSMFWREDIDVSEIDDILFNICADVQRVKEENLSSILGTSVVPVSPGTKKNPNRLSTMKRFRIPEDDVRVQEGLLSDLFFLNKYRYNTTTMRFKMGNNLEGSLVYVPPSRNYRRLKINMKKTNWFLDMLSALGGESHESDTLTNLLTYVARTDSFYDIYVDVVKNNGLVLPKFDAITTWTIQSLCNMNNNQMRTLRRCLKSEVGSSLFSTERKISQITGLEHIEPTTGCHVFGNKRRVYWSYKSAIDTLLLLIKKCFDARWEKLDVVVAIDHGKGHSRITLTTIARWFESGIQKEKEYINTLGNARCKKDNHEILTNTYANMLNADMKKIKTSGKFSICSDGSVVLGSSANGKEIPVKIFLAGDLLFFAMACGKEGSASWWCTYCDLIRTDWQIKGCRKGDLWSLDKLKEHHQKIVDGIVKKTDAREVKGVRTLPLFDFVDIDHYIVPVLHLMLGK